MAEIIRIIIVNGGELTNGAAGLTNYILPYGVACNLFLCRYHYNFTNFLRSATGRQAITLS